MCLFDSIHNFSMLAASAGGSPDAANQVADAFEFFFIQIASLRDRGYDVDTHQVVNLERRQQRLVVKGIALDLSVVRSQCFHEIVQHRDGTRIERSERRLRRWALRGRRALGEAVYG
jgi:hypothetical protein